MGRKGVLFVTVVCIALLFAAGTIYAATTVQDVIKLENKKGLVEFSHKKHHEEYKLGCGECHHDDKGKPRNDLKMGDDVKACIDCHKKPGEMPGALKKEMREKKASKKEIAATELEYVGDAFHANCIDCHKAYNKKNKTKAAPQSCSKCHQKAKK